MVASSLVRSLSPAEDPAVPPSWLLPEQATSFRRVLAALRCYRGALLADPVGSGKTFVALALAAALNHGPTACLVPASLAAQWKAAAGRTQVPIVLWTHEQVSRGRLPHKARGLIVIDESHHFRNPHTKRYRNLAPWLIGHPVLLVTATPIVNRSVDLAHQLLLAVADDALALSGVSSLRAMLSSGSSMPALGQLVFESELPTSRRPHRVVRSVPATAESSTLTRALDLVSQLRLSKSDPIAALIRGVLCRALASSPAAFGGALRRYRNLLLHARDAARSGRTVDRSELRAFTRGLADQLVWWELLPLMHAPSEVELADLENIENLIRHAEATAACPDDKLTTLANVLEDGAPTLVFATFRDTVTYIRRRLAHLRLAWCTGRCAGVGTATLTRATVLGWFREATTSSLAPTHLIVTDVAAEGLDLQRAGRVVHYDLPWNPMRIEQREGRALRYGSRHAQVEVVQIGLPRMLERRLKLEATLRHKSWLPAAAGLGPAGRDIWRWRAELVQQFKSVPARYGVATIPDPSAGLLTGFGMWRGGRQQTLGGTVIWIEPNGGWTEDPEVIKGRLAIAATQHQVVPADSAELSQWLGILAHLLRDRLAVIRGRRWLMPEPAPAASWVMGRLQSLIGDAARRHQAVRMAELERALAIIAGGHTAGEAALIERMAKASDSEMMSLIGRLSARELRVDGLEIRLTGLILFSPAKPDRAALASLPWSDSRRLSSTSTEP